MRRFGSISMRKSRSRDAIVDPSALAEERAPIAVAWPNETVTIPSFGYLLISAPIEASDLLDRVSASLRDVDL